MITKVFLARDEVVLQPVDSAAVLAQKKKLAWVRVVNPSDEEVDLLASFLSFEEQDLDELKSFLKEGDRSRVEKYDFLRIVYSVPTIVDKEIETEELLIFGLKNMVLTVERTRLQVCELLFSRFQKQKGKYLLKRNAGFFISELIDEINGRFQRHVNKIESNLDVLSGKGKMLTNVQVEAISSANNTLSFFNQATLANIEVLNTLRKMYHIVFLPADREAFADIYFDALQVLDTLKIQREMIMNIFNIQSIISSNEMNLFMKKLTALALIIMIPTLISGIYGMNVTNLPFAQHGFWVIVGLMVVVTAVLYVIFKKFDWL